MNRDFRDLFAEFSARGVRFLVVGAHAVMFYTVPRYTKDLDLWVECSHENAARVLAALDEFGAPLADLTAQDLATAGTVFQIGVEPNRIDLLTEVEGVAFGQAWERAVESTYGEVPIRILAKADLIRAKTAAGRPQDLLDLEWLARAPEIDRF